MRWVLALLRRRRREEPKHMPTLIRAALLQANSYKHGR